MLRPTGKKSTSKGEYIETDSGNKVSRRSAITGTANITLGGRTVIMADVQLRGDLHPMRSVSSQQSASASASASASGPGTGREVTPTSISIGRCTVISTGTVIKPPCRISRGQVHYYPMKIGDNVFVGPNCTIQAINLSSHVHVGEKVSIGPFVIVKEKVKILPHTVIPANMVIASGSVVAGRPARIVGEVGEGWGVGGGAGGAGGEGKWVEGGDLRELVRSIR